MVPQCVGVHLFLMPPNCRGRLARTVWRAVCGHWQPTKELAVRSITTLFLASLVASTQARTKTIEGLVVGVTDGDTITLLDVDNRQHKIRLDAIDAPENGQQFGRASKVHLARLLANRQATAECSKVDRFRRQVCRVVVGGVDVGLQQIRAGMAWYFRRYARSIPVDRRQQYANMEALAKGERLGLWADAEPTAPWDWRAKGKRATAPR
jgi:endonuclease YncB( thermonuclease family)